MSKKKFIERSLKAYRNLESLYEDPKYPTQIEVAVEIGISRHTLMRYLKRFGVSWEQIHSQTA